MRAIDRIIIQSLPLALVLLLAMSMAACQEVQATCTEIAPQQPPESLPDVSPALVEDARSYAEDYGVSLNEAIRRLSGQNEIGNLGSELESGESATFGGLWIQNEPDYRVVVAFTKDGEKTIRPYLERTSVAATVKVCQVDKSLVELKKAREEAEEMVKGLGFNFGSGLDIPNNMVQLYLTEAKIEELEIELKKAGLTLPDNVELVAALPARPA
ncbi:MAG: hypothetical protein F4X57_13185 [Chloroflexi bacterium]|nr:hypothetical protein [Chloroflexota bacterium]